MWQSNEIYTRHRDDKRHHGKQCELAWVDLGMAVTALYRHFVQGVSNVVHYISGVTYRLRCMVPATVRIAEFAFVIVIWTANQCNISSSAVAAVGCCEQRNFQMREALHITSSQPVCSSAKSSWAPTYKALAGHKGRPHGEVSMA
jgi:hypothetical protein